MISRPALLTRSAPAALFLLGLSCAQTPVDPVEHIEPVELVYPPARTCDQVDEYFGVEVADPYRWMEEDVSTPELAAWVEAENAITCSYLDAIPERESIIERLTELWDYERIGIPERSGGREFFSRNDGLQNQAVLMVVDGPGAEPRVLLDPNILSPDGTIALADIVPSPDGEVLAYGLSEGGSDWREWRFRDVSTGEDLPDVVKWNKFGGLEWAEGRRAVVYMRFPQPNEGDELREKNQAADLCLHVMGTAAEGDVVLSEAPAEEGIGQWCDVTASGRAVLAIREEAKSDNHEIDVISLASEDHPRVPLIAGFDAQYQSIGNDESTIFFRTNLDAPTYRIIAIDVENRERDQWREVIPAATETMGSADLIGGRIVASYLKDATSLVRLFELDGTPAGEVDLPGIGTATGVRGEADSPITYYSFYNWVTPPATYRYDVSTGKSELFHRPEVAFDPADYVVDQVFYESLDGTRVPMFLAYKKGLKRDGSNRTLLYGYGGFNISLTPRFRTNWLLWMEMGGVAAVPNLRGGGEYGEAWHEAGTKLKKQNVFDDFIAAGEWLIENDYTCPEKLAISGASNGGLLVGAVMIQRPELFGAALPAVGVMDMLRFHKFTIGWAWVGDYGSSENEEEFKAIHEYSPLHNLKDGVAYPATLVETADRDDRVVPAHSFKFAARLQAAHGGDAPVLIHIGTRAGHGAGKPTAKRIEEAADVLAFLVNELGG